MKRVIYLMVCLLAAVSPSLGDAIHAAAVAGNEELLQKLLAEQPQQVNAVDPQLGATPLHLAASRQSYGSQIG
jgi:ankyrin repeat protein